MPNPFNTPEEAMAAVKDTRAALSGLLTKLEERKYDITYVSYYDELFEMKEKVYFLVTVAKQTGDNSCREVEEAHAFTRAYELAVMRCIVNMLVNGGDRLNKILSQRATGPLPGDMKVMRESLHQLAEHIQANVRKP